MCTGTGPSVLLKQSKTLALHVHVFNVNIMYVHSCVPTTLTSRGTRAVSTTCM